MIIKGCNDFYEGWIQALILDSEVKNSTQYNSSQSFRDGANILLNTNMSADKLLHALNHQRKLGNVIVLVESADDPSQSEFCIQSRNTYLSYYNPDAERNSKVPWFKFSPVEPLKLSLIEAQDVLTIVQNYYPNAKIINASEVKVHAVTA